MLNATIEQKKVFNPGLFLLRVRPDTPFQLFLPGQYVTLGLPGSAARPPDGPGDPEEVKPDKLIRRAYSIASAPHERDAVEFYVALVPEGLLTPRLMMLKEGDRVHMTPKCVGKFTLDGVPQESSLVFLSTGTGIAPFISMIRTPAVWEGRESITLLHGVRYVSDLSYTEELLALEQKVGPRFRYVPVVSREDPPPGGYRGYVQRILSVADVRAEAGKDHVFACGNPAMVTEVETSLLACGFKLHEGKAHGDLHLEKYW